MTPSRVVERATHRTDVQIRSADADKALFVGYASTVGDGYEVRDFLGEYRETIVPRAFAKSLREKAQPGGRGVPLLIDHDSTQILANTTSGTSRLSEDSHGLRNEADLDRRQVRANDMIVSLERGDISRMSFSFGTVKDTWNKDYTDRQVTELELFDTSIVTFPSNPATSAAMQSEARSRLGREGLWRLGDLRAELPHMAQQRHVPFAPELLDGAIRAFSDADLAIVQRFGPQSRGRALLVGRALTEMREGKVLSAANQDLLQTALTALSSADQQHQQLQAAHTTAADAVSTVLSNGGSGDGATGSEASGSEGISNSTPPGNGNPISPQDGAGARAVQLSRLRATELARLRDGRSPRRETEKEKIARLSREREIELAHLRREFGGRS